MIQPTERAKQKTDRRDAGELRAPAVGPSPAVLEGKHPLGLRRVQLPTPQEAEDRQLTMLRAVLTRKRTAVINGIHKLLAQAQPRTSASLPKACRPRRCASGWRRWSFLPMDRMETGSALAAMGLARAAIEGGERKDRRAGRGRRAGPALGDGAGHGPLQRLGHPFRASATSIASSTPTAWRTISASRPAAATPGEATQALRLDHQAGQQDRALPPEPGGDQGPAVRRHMRAWFQRIKKRRGAEIARVAVMRRLATILWHMLKRKQRYRFASPARRGPGGVVQGLKAVLTWGASPKPPKDLTHEGSKRNG